MKVQKLCLKCVLVFIQILFIVNCSDNVTFCIPNDFSSVQNLCIGNSVAELSPDSMIKYDNSIGYLIEQPDNRYFDLIYLYVHDEHTVLDEMCFERITYDEDTVRILINGIITECSQQFGKDYYYKQLSNSVQGFAANEIFVWNLGNNKYAYIAYSDGYRKKYKVEADSSRYKWVQLWVSDTLPKGITIGK